MAKTWFTPAPPRLGTSAYVHGIYPAGVHHPVLPTNGRGPLGPHPALEVDSTRNRCKTITVCATWSVRRDGGVVRLEIEPVSCASFTGGTAIIHSVYRHLITRDAAGTPPDLRRRGIRSSFDDHSATGWDLGRQIPACRAPSMRRMASEPPHRADRPRSG